MTSIFVNEYIRINLFTGVIHYREQVVELPPKSKKHQRNISIINNKLYVNGYQFTDGKWKRTLRSTWHRYFK